MKIVIFDRGAEALCRSSMALLNLLLAAVQGRLVPHGQTITGKEDFLVSFARDSLAALVFAQHLLVPTDAVGLDTLEMGS